MFLSEEKPSSVRMGASSFGKRYGIIQAMEEKHTTLKKWIYRILVVLWMVVIFAHSAMDATDSSQESGVIVTFITEHLISGYDEMEKEQQLEVTDTVTIIVRKGAHMTEYAILGFLLVGALEIRHLAILWLVAWMVAIAYAGTDEFHQTFVPGRSGELRDVYVDSAGALIGVSVAIWREKIKLRKADALD